MKVGLLLLLSSALPLIWAADNTTRPAFTFSKTLTATGTVTGAAVATDPAGNIYVAGTTTAADFPVVNGFQKRIGGVPFRASTDGGKTWTMPGIPDPVYAVAGAVKQANVVYAGTATTMYKSTDSGKTWTALPDAGTALVNAIWVDPDTPATVHAATDRGMIRSEDAGATWRAAPTGKGNVLSMCGSPARPSTLFAAMDIGTSPRTSSLYRSVDSGATWTVLPNAPFGPYSLACDPKVAGAVYLAASTTGFTSAGSTALYKSTDSGDRWSTVSFARLVVSTWTVTASPDTVYLATRDGLLRSTNGGASWNATPITASASEVAVDPVSPQNVYANTDLGLFASTDSGVTWTNTLPIRQFCMVVAVAPTSPPTVYVGAAPGRNVFVSKYSPDGKQLLYSTYLGGSYFDTATAIAVDRVGNAYVTGYAWSNDFPVTANAAQKLHGGGYDAFVAKIDTVSGALLYSTYLGGTTNDAAFGVALDSAGNIYATGSAASADFPVTAGAFQKAPHTFTGCTYRSLSSGPPSTSNSFVAKIDPVSGALRYSTYLGGGCFDVGIGIAVDSSGSAYVAGASSSGDFPVTAGVVQREPGSVPSQTTGFLAKLSPQGDALTFATYLGGTAGSGAFAVALDAKGAIYVTGDTVGFDGPRFPPNGFTSSSPTVVGAIPGAGLNAFQGGAAYVAKLAPGATSLDYVRYLGGTWGAGTGIAVDPFGNAWIAGRTLTGVATPSFPTLHPFQAKIGSGFVAELAPDGAILFSSLTEAAQQIALNPPFQVAVAGTAGGAYLLGINASSSELVTVEEPPRFSAGQILSISGSGLGPAQPAGAQLDANGNIPASLAGTTVTFDGIPAPILSAQSDRIVCIVPFRIPSPGLPMQLQVRSASGSSNAIRLTSDWSAIQLLAAVNADGTVNSREHPAAPGSSITFYGTGFGQTIPAGQDGRINGTAAATFAMGPVGAKIGDQAAAVLFAGPAPGQVAGVVQVNARIPALAPGSYNAAVGWTLISGLSDTGTVPIWIATPALPALAESPSPASRPRRGPSRSRP